MTSGPKKNSVETCTDAGCGCHSRREFLWTIGAGSAALLGSGLPAVAGPFESGASDEFERLIPADKKFTKQWLDALVVRGEPETHTGDDLRYIGMPVGGICAGMLYLGGDGRLWLWNIFNRDVEGVAARQVRYADATLGSRDGAAYVEPVEPQGPVRQGFALRVRSAGAERIATLDRRGFANVSFTGQYPIGTVVYSDPALAVSVKLEAYSPFIPLDEEDSGLPATVMSFTLKNETDVPVEATLCGWLENAVCLYHRQLEGIRKNDVADRQWGTLLAMSAIAPTKKATAERADIPVEDWGNEKYEGWTPEGAAFGAGPVAKRDIPTYQGDVGGPTDRVVNSHATAPGGNVGEKDSQTGRLVGREFTIERNFIHIWIGGGDHQDKTCVNLRVDGKTVLSLTGRNDNRMRLDAFDVRRWQGKRASLEIVDAERGAWGNIGVGRIVQSDAPPVQGALSEQSDFGTMALALLGAPAEHRAASVDLKTPHGLGAAASDRAEAPLERDLVGSLGRTIALAPGAAATVSFVVAWHFPNLTLAGSLKGRHYATRFSDAAAVAGYVAANFARLSATTRRWHDTWYDSTLPHWFLNRTFANTSTLATTTCYRLGDGRFWAWEGVGCCPGTCTHVWHYAQAMARIFPELERNQRERVDLGLSFDERTGVIRYRGEFSDIPFAVDGQCGTILRAYREHQMSADGEFLKRVWPRLKLAVECVLGRDKERSGILSTPMLNTLDAQWYGVVPWISGLYHAALRAAEELAREAGDETFAAQCRAVFDKGRVALDERTWNERYEYFVHVGDPDHATEVGSYDGCHIDQALGQAWAWQVGLGSVMHEEHARKALRSLWRYNLAPDVGPYRKVNKAGRWYAMPGDGGLLMVTFPFGKRRQVTGGGAWSAMYFNECMSGFEWQVSAHMLWEGLTTEGLAVARLIHDRYHPRLRNPYNEIECSDHYARAMASYGAFLAACGYEYHGPKGHLGFAPRLGADDFRAAFTTAEGWGTFAQTRRDGGPFEARLTLAYGRLRLRSLALRLPEGATADALKVELAGKPVTSQFVQRDRRATISFSEDILLDESRSLRVEFS